jgi:hypothetical protein
MIGYECPSCRIGRQWVQQRDEQNAHGLPSRSSSFKGCMNHSKVLAE